MPRIFVRRGCVDTYERLREVFGEEPDVQVLWDRRAEERRTRGQRRRTVAHAQHAQERRTDERRTSDWRKPNPSTWLTLDFVVTD